MFQQASKQIDSNTQVSISIYTHQISLDANNPHIETMDTNILLWHSFVIIAFRPGWTTVAFDVDTSRNNLRA